MANADSIQNCYNAREAATNGNTNNASQSDTENNKEHIKRQEDYAKPAKQDIEKLVYDTEQKK